MEENHDHHVNSHNEFPTRERIRILTRTLKPVPFRPTKALDFARHETLLRRIGLWEFAHVEFDRNIHVDLVSQLIGSFSPALRCGYVNGVRVLANRVQLGRVLKLPLMEKKKEGETLEGLNFADESIGFVEEFVRNWVVLHDDRDACDMMIKMPNEVLQCRRLIREGRLEKVDWGGLVWTMAEREIRDPGLVKCHYASHLQLLIRVQHEELLLQGVPVVVLEDDEDEGGVVRMAEVELLQGEEVKEEVPVVRTGGVGDSEENNIELSLGGGHFGKVGWGKKMDLEESKGEPFLHQSGDDEELEEEGEEDDDDEIPVEEEMNEDRHHAIQAVGTPFRPVIDLNEYCFGDFISHQDNPQMISGPSSFFGNGHTHRRDHIDMVQYHNIHPSLMNGNNKRPRLDNPNNAAEPADFDICMNQIQHWMAKARSMYAIKYQSCEESTVNERLLLDELCNRDSMINQLRKELIDESQKGQRNVYRLEKELHMMGKLADGYREALRGAQKAFDEYIARCMSTSQ